MAMQTLTSKSCVQGKMYAYNHINYNVIDNYLTST